MVEQKDSIRITWAIEYADVYGDMKYEYGEQVFFCLWDVECIKNPCARLETATLINSSQLSFSFNKGNHKT